MDLPITLHIPDLHPTDSTPRGIAKAIVDTMGGEIESGLLDASEEITFTTDTLVVQNTKIEALPSSDRQQTLQNKSGVLALLDDTFGVRDTVILPEGLVSVDWEAFYMFHQKAGMKIDLLLVNSGTKQLVGTWDAAIKWPSSVAPVMPAATPGTSALLLVTIRDVNDVLYGEYVNFPVTPPISP